MPVICSSSTSVGRKRAFTPSLSRMEHILRLFVSFRIIGHVRKALTVLKSRRWFSFAVRHLEVGLLVTLHHNRVFSYRGGFWFSRDSLFSGPKFLARATKGKKLLRYVVQPPRQYDPGSTPSPRRVLLQLPHAQVPFGHITGLVVYLVLDICEHPSGTHNVLDIYFHIPLENWGDRVVSWHLAAHWKSPRRTHGRQTV